MQDHIPDALITAFERQYDSSWNDPQLRNERLAMRYGWTAAMEAKPCLHQIQEPAPVLAALAAVAVPDGWKLVPDAENMTDEQAEAIAELARVCGGGALDIYRAALESAPEHAALAATPAEKPNSVEFDGIKTAAPVVLPEPDADYKLVPVALTPEMKREFMDLLMDGIDIYVNSRDQIEIQTDAPRRIWSTVLALSPTAPAPFAAPATGGQAQTEQHPDDAAVDALAALMKAKLAKQRTKGYGGWDTDCTRERLSELLRGHVDKGDPVDVANFCAFLSARGEGIAPQAQAEPVAWTVGGEVTNWSRDFSKYKTQHYVCPVFSASMTVEDARAAELLGFLQDQCIDLRCFTTSDGEDVGWRTVQHHMSEPRERVVSEVYGDQPRRAIREAMARIERDPYCTGPLHLEDDAAIAAAKGEAQ